MAYIVYHKDSTKYLSGLTRKCKHNSFATEGAAKAALTRACKADTSLVKEDFLITDHVKFAGIEKTHMVTNIMTQKQVKESVNTPWSCSVASETYWSS